MTRALFIFLFAIFYATSAAQNQNITEDFLAGQWSLVKRERIEDSFNAMEYVRPLPGDNVWVFSDRDVLTRYNYPLEFIHVIYFELDSNRLYWYQSDNVFAALAIDSGKLVAIVDEARLTFRRDTFSPAMMNCLSVLRKDTVNPGLLREKYFMVTRFAPDDEEAYDFTPPVKMPRSFKITDSAEARSLLHSGVIYLRTGGKKREFHVVDVDWDGSTYGNRNGFYVMDVPFIRLVQGDWWKGDDFTVIYRAGERKMIKSGSANVQKVQ